MALACIDNKGLDGPDQMVVDDPSIMPVIHEHGTGKDTLNLLAVESLSKLAISVLESEIFGSECSDDSEAFFESTSSVMERSCAGALRDTFQQSQSQWIHDPTINQWRNSKHRIHTVLSELENLHQEWKDAKIGPFSPLTDKLWRHTGSVLRDVGLPWHNNQINMPNELDTSWPFHFKSFERQVIRAKGSRVGDPDATGYVCNWAEANCYAIRALQQELREKYREHRPVLVYDKIEIEIPNSAERLFGLELHHVKLSQSTDAILQELRGVTSNGVRPIIFAATLTNVRGEYDNMQAICRVSESLPLILHLDAARNFDYVTTMTEGQRRTLGLEKFTLALRTLDSPIKSTDGCILASTIVAGGSNHTSPPPVVALKPSKLGSAPTMVAYTRASDSTLAGSRDALAPLWMALQEIRFGGFGFRDIYQHCARTRTALVEALKRQDITTITSPYSLDIIFKGCSTIQTSLLVQLGGVPTEPENVLLTIQPSVTSQDFGQVLQIISPGDQDLRMMADIPCEESFALIYPVPKAVIHQLETIVQSWKVVTRSAAGYPFHMGSYSALGPVIGHFLDISIPQPWIQARSDEIITSRLKTFGLESLKDRLEFKGAFTNGSTMGNRVGIHTALAHFPNAYIYYSREAHYSVAKTLRDCDTLTNRWSNRGCRYSQIDCDSNGRMLVDVIVRQAVLDREECQRYGEPYYLVLFATSGTTFVGARDDLVHIRQQLSHIGAEISYVHMDGALDFGFGDCGVRLGPPGAIDVSGALVVQGVTLSHHKAMGNTVSGEVLCYSPGDQLATLGSGVDPRAIFETWLYMQVYSSTDLAHLHRYCQDNAALLEAGLNDLGVVTKRNRDSIITVLERPPAWIVEEFSLRPEGDWVHFITMPHISPETIQLFLERITWVDEQCKIVFSYINPLISAVMKQPIRLQRVQCRSSLAGKLEGIFQSSVKSTLKHPWDLDRMTKASLMGAMTIVAVNDHDRVQAIFLAESTRDRAIRAGPLLVESHHSSSGRLFQDIARQLIGFMARHLYVEVRHDGSSYMPYWFQNEHDSVFRAGLHDS